MRVTNPTVHVVDDDTSFLAAISRLLRASGFAVKTFSSANDFLAQCDADSPGCVLADLQMPGMKGFDLQLALAQTRNPLPIVFLTGHGDIPSSVRAMRGGAEDFLEKRAPKDKVLDAVKRSLARDTCERESRTRQRNLARAVRRSQQTGTRSACPRRAGEAQQADCRRSRHPRADGETAPHCDHDEAQGAVRRRTHAVDAAGGHVHGV